MATHFPHVFEPVKVGNTWLKNRIISLPTGICSDAYGQHIPQAELIKHLENHAKNGAAMVVMTGGNLFPVPSGDDSWVVDLYSRSALNALGHMAECIHMYGAKISMELHQGAVDFDGYGVSDGIRLPNGIIAKEMPKAYMPKILKAYADVSWNLKNAGWDGVMLHFGHGWTVGQFLSPLTNHRTDEFGGSTENRCRFPRMIVEAIRDRVGPDFLIDVRLSISEFEPGGIEPDEAIRIIELLQDKIDLVNASCGLHNVKWFTTTHPCGFLPPMPNAYLARLVKESGKIHIPVTALGGVQDFNEAEKLLATGGADLIGVARAFIADSEFAKKGFEGRTGDIRPCIKCMRCHDTAVFTNKYHCSVNPAVGMEHVLETQPKLAERSKKVAVIGGGPAGMQAALTALERGHDVTLYEKEGQLGGALNFAKYVSFKYALNDYREYLIRQVEKSAVRIMLNTAATKEMLLAAGYDAVLVAVGADVVVPPVPGVEHAVLAVDTYGKEERLPEELVIVGGGQIGCETALHLARCGKKVRLLEMQADLAPDASWMHRGELLNQLCWDPNIVCETGAKVLSVESGGVRYARLPGKWKTIAEEKDLYGESAVGGALWADVIAAESGGSADAGEGEESYLPAQAVILAVGMRAREEESRSFLGSAAEVIPVGNCVKAGTVENASRSAFYAARSL